MFIPKFICFFQYQLAMKVKSSKKHSINFFLKGRNFRGQKFFAEEILAVEWSGNWKLCGINFREWCLEKSQNEAIVDKIYKKGRIFALKLLIYVLKVTYSTHFSYLLMSWWSLLFWIERSSNLLKTNFCNCSITCKFRETYFRNIWPKSWKLILRRFVLQKILSTKISAHKINIRWMNKDTRAYQCLRKMNF